MDFAKLLNDKMLKAAAATRGAEQTDPGQGGKAAGEVPASHDAVEGEIPLPSPSPVSRRGSRKANPVQAGKPSNTNRVTVNLFDADRRALAIIKEHLANAGHDFTNRSDSIKIGLRLAAKARKEELARLFLGIRAEDRRHSSSS